MNITLKCGCEGEVLEDGEIIITKLCPSDAVEVLELEEKREAERLKQNCLNCSTDRRNNICRLATSVGAERCGA